MQVAWISYDDYRRLLAPEGQTEQPAIQKAADPVEQAPLRFDATDPKPQPQERQPAPMPPAGGGRPQPVKRLTSHEGMLPPSTPPAEPTRRTPPTPRPSDADGTGPGRSVAAARKTPREASNPTAAPRSDGEASPVTIQSKSKIIRAGRVITAEGIRIQTVAPRFSTVTYLTAMRGGIQMPVRVRFGRDGHVREAQLLDRSGYPEVDTPIRASLFKWRATGERLKQIDGPFELSITLRIGHR